MWLTARVILLLTLISDFAASVKDSKFRFILSKFKFYLHVRVRMSISKISLVTWGHFGYYYDGFRITCGPWRPLLRCAGSHFPVTWLRRVRGRTRACLSVLLSYLWASTRVLIIILLPWTYVIICRCLENFVFNLCCRPIYLRTLVYVNFVESYPCEKHGLEICGQSKIACGQSVKLANTCVAFSSTVCERDCRFEDHFVIKTLLELGKHNNVSIHEHWTCHSHSESKTP